VFEKSWRIEPAASSRKRFPLSSFVYPADEQLPTGECAENNGKNTVSQPVYDYSFIEHFTRNRFFSRAQNCDFEYFLTKKS
jgi:hypothetical protein